MSEEVIMNETMYALNLESKNVMEIRSYYRKI